MPDVELHPVRRRGRVPLDRGAVVALGIVVVIGLAVWKPWSSDAPPQRAPAVADADTVHSARPDARPSGLSAAPSVSQPQTSISLADVRLREAGQTEYDVFSALVATTWDTSRVAFHSSLPEAAELGSSCEGGAMVGEGVESIGVTTATVPVTSYELLRLFESGAPVATDVVVEESAADGLVLSAAQRQGFHVGHYALVLRAYGAIRVVPLCVGIVLRLVDYSLVKYVPPTASTAAAREAFCSLNENACSE